ncbi:LPS export ABC transporter permease LptG [Gemmobacter serpentinus]|uniref:LPS export ABC transporter permease LptG n=1 Tax=Gemmobacter serpentinus TaxID=2652247 RepID=UPI00124EF6C8|nr:LPS export ABC transporter permease LptG [Gemmobacter serpentinus]
MTLSLYIARRFFWMFIRVLGVFFGILMLIDMLDQLRRLSGKGVGLVQAMELSALNVPESLYNILPLIMILAAIAMFLGFARSSELVVVRAAGRSGLRFLLAPIVVSLMIGIVAVAVLNPLVAATSKAYEARYAGYARGAERVLSVSEDGLWLRQGGDGSQTVIHASRANADGTQLYGVTFLSFDEEGLPRERVEAESARLQPGAWAVEKVRRWRLDALNPQQGIEVLDTATLPSDLTADAIRDSFGSPAAIPVWELPAFIRGLERAGFSARNHQVWLQMQLALPLLMSAMVLIAAGFTMRHARFGGTGLLVLFSLLGGFAMFFLRNFAQVLGQNGQVPVMVAAWAPPLAAALFALGLLLHLEDG